MKLLYNEKEINFYLDKKFNIKYLLPIHRYVQWKIENDKWDDYNELYHASKFIENINNFSNVWIDSHLFFKNDIIIGVLFIVGGNIKRIENKISFEDEAQSLLLKYFHIIEKGNGYGSLWLNSIVFPYYKKLGYDKIYVNSSHIDSFPFYNRLGEKIFDYEQKSDNEINIRKGNQFLIKL